MKAYKPNPSISAILLLVFTSICLLAIVTKLWGNPAIPRLLNYQGKLSDTNGPITGTVNLTLSIYDGLATAVPLWTETHPNVTVTDGLFNLLLGGLNPIPDSILSGGERYFEVTVNGESMPRLQLASVLFALKAQDAETVGGKSESAFAVATHTHGGSGGDNHSLDAADGNPTDAVFVDNEGNVGVGTVSPETKLNINGAVRIFNGPYKTTMTQQGDTFTIQSYAYLITKTAGYISFETYSSGYKERLRIALDGNVGIGTTNPRGTLHLRSPLGQLYLEDSDNGKKWRITTAGRFGGLDFRYQPDEADELKDVLRLRENGNVGIGTAHPSAKLDVAGTVKATALFSDGNLTVAPGYAALADSWSTRSSRRWKTNIQPIEGALDKVQRIRGVEYERKADGVHNIGLIAEEVGEVIPEVVDYEANGVDAKSVDYDRLVAVLIEAVKEQQQEIDALKMEMTQLRQTQAK